MKQFFKNSQTGSVKDACQGMTNPKIIMLSVCDKEKLEACAKELKEYYPDVPSVAYVANAYGTSMCEKGCTVIAFDDVSAQLAVVKEVSKCPVKYIKNVEDAIKAIKPGTENTCCINFCTGNDAVVLSTFDSILTRNHIQLIGGTVDAGVVAVNGEVISDADVCVLVKNLSGKVKTYKENLYVPMGKEYTYTASDTDRSKYYVGKLGGVSAQKVYCDALGIKKSDINTQTFSNPLGKMIGKDICIISIKDVEGEGLVCYRQVNDSDVIRFLEIQDVNAIIEKTKQSIKRDFKHISSVFSVNCAFRYLYFKDKLESMDNYLQMMNELSNHVGYVGFGEEFGRQFINQSFVCVVFE